MWSVLVYLPSWMGALLLHRQSPLFTPTLDAIVNKCAFVYIICDVSPNIQYIIVTINIELLVFVY